MGYGPRSMVLGIIVEVGSRSSVRGDSRFQSFNREYSHRSFSFGATSDELLP